jgi:hypothetical protein
VSNDAPEPSASKIVDVTFVTEGCGARAARGGSSCGDVGVRLSFLQPVRATDAASARSNGRNIGGVGLRVKQSSHLPCGVSGAEYRL